MASGNYHNFTEQGLGENFATNTKFLAVVPLQLLFTDLHGDLVLNLTAFTFPTMEVGSTTVSYLSKMTAVPTKVLTPESHEIQFRFILSANYHQYILLMRWMQRATVEMQHNTNFVNAGDVTKYRIPISVYFLSEFKTPIVKFQADDAWISKIDELVMDYASPSDEPIHCGFAVKYSSFSVVTLADTGGVDGRTTINTSL